MGAQIEELNLFQICEMLVPDIAFIPCEPQPPCRYMVVCLHQNVTFLLFLCADRMRPESDAMTTQYASFSFAGIDLSSATISLSSLG